MNWTLIIVALITATPPTLMAFVAWRAGKRNAKAIQDVHISINSRMDKLLEANGDSKFAEGREEGRNEKK